MVFSLGHYLIEVFQTFTCDSVELYPVHSSFDHIDLITLSQGHRGVGNVKLHAVFSRTCLFDQV